MPDEESELSFAEFMDRIQPHRAVIGFPEWPHTTPIDEEENHESRKYAELFARREEFETPSLPAVARRHTAPDFRRLRRQNG